MSGLLTNAGEGYKYSIRDSGPATFFRTMSRMAVPEGGSIISIEPRAAARVMVYNPLRDDQICVCKIGAVTINAETGEAHLEVDARYIADDSDPVVYFYDGAVYEAEKDGNIYIVDDPIYIDIMAERINTGEINNGAKLGGYIIYSGESTCIDMYLDWDRCSKGKPVPSRMYSHIDKAVKSGDRGDTLSRWREILPTGMDVNVDGTGKITVALSMGVVFSDIKSIYAPQSIVIDLTDYIIRLYLCIDSIYEQCFPKYNMHPGQWLYSGGVTPTYYDGELFLPANPELFRTPKSAMMGIIRGSIVFDGLLTDGLEIGSIEIEYNKDVTHDEIYPTYALSNYSVVLESQQYAEDGDVDYDTIGSMRYIGYYGRNPMYMNTITDNIITINEEISAIADADYEIISDESALTVNNDTVTINAGNKTRREDEDTLNVIDNFYYVSIKNPPHRIAERVNLIKIYIVGTFVDGGNVGVIDAVKTWYGYVLNKVLETGELTEELPYAASNINTDLVVDGAYNGLSAVVHTGGEYMRCIIASETISDISSRPLYQTRRKTHARENEVTLYNPYFHNTYIGRIEHVVEDEYTINGMSGYATPDDGYMLIENEIIKYTKIGEESITIEARSVYGSTPCSNIDGKGAYYISYFTIGDIDPLSAKECEYSDRYAMRASMPLNYSNDPSHSGATAVYLMEIIYNANKANKVWK